MSANSWSAVDATTVPAKLARELRDAWEHFVTGPPAGGGDETDDQVRDTIVASWQRSRDAGVDPHGRVLAPAVMDPADVPDYWEQHPLAVAAPLVESLLRETAEQSDHLLVVSDERGTLLRVEGDVHIRSRAADEMNFTTGSGWSEAGAGTNAVGTAIATGHAVQVFAAEHFTAPVQRWTCAAAPVHEPESGRVVGVIDLTGDFNTVHPHSLSAVMATAQAIESFLLVLMHERDDVLRARFAALLDAGPVPRALLSAGGRLLHGRPEEWAPEGRLAIPGGGGELLLPSGGRAVAEPVAEGQAFVLSRLDHAPAREQRRRLELRLLGEEPHASLDGREIALRPRHAELLVLLGARRKGTDAEHLSLELYGERGNPASVRVEMSRLRKLLPGCLDPERYMLAVEPHSDAEEVRRALREGDARAAAATYPGPLLERSEAPGVERERHELEGWLRNAVLTSGDVEALWHWTQSSSGADDLMAWSRFVAGIAYDDARRPHAAAHLKALREAL